MKRYYLLIDAAHEPGGVWLWRGAELVGQLEFGSGPQLGKAILEALEGWLSKEGAAVADLARIGVHEGPGGYSRLRGGVATGQSLALASGAELVGVAGDLAHEMERSLREGVLVETISPRYARPGFGH